MRALKWLDKNFEECILMIFLALMTVIMGIQITMRYVFNNSLVWSEELTRYLFIWSTFISLGFCVKRSLSIKIDQFTNMIPDTSIARKIITFAVKVVMLVFFIYVFRHSIDVVKAAIASGQRSPAMGVPMYIVQSSTVVGFFLAILRTIQCLIEEIMSFRSAKPIE
ncbi:MAG: TRAP transporter small permease [Bacillota bacterium]